MFENQPPACDEGDRACLEEEEDEASLRWVGFGMFSRSSGGGVRRRRKKKPLIPLIGGSCLQSLGSAFAKHDRVSARNKVRNWRNVLTGRESRTYPNSPLLITGTTPT
ncbi:unnamed protein product [Linum trigynum]|uniref:Uncharacterized protein n=1 Tax=Linum trigynum TaxID=586398 RepID=A0AAV2E6N3_9ROSI